jgi:hypothetical protein
MSDIVSAKSIQAQMPHGTLTRITGKPTHKQLQILEKKLAANLMAIPCPWGHRKGHLSLLQDPVLYFQCNGASYTVPGAAPPDYPINLPTAAPACEAAWAANLAKRKAWNTYIIIYTITHNQFAAAIDYVYHAELDDPTKGLNAISLWTLSLTFAAPMQQFPNPTLTTTWPNLLPASNLPSHLLSTHLNRRSVRCLPKTPVFQSPKQQWSPPA